MAAVETAMSMSDRSKARRGAFFGRRKGHALRPRQAELFDTLLPQLAIELAEPAPPDLGPVSYTHLTLPTIYSV